MKKGIIITMPRYDDVTEYFSQYSKEIIKEAKAEGVAVRFLVDKEATKELFENMLISFPYNLVVINGHGTVDEIFGHDKKAILANDINDKLIADRIIYARACAAGASLGKAIASLSDKGCFIGYNLPFQFYANSTWAGNPLKDNTARIFFGPSNAIPIAIIAGKSAGMANEDSKKMILKNMDKVLRKIDPDSLAIAEALWNNYEGQVLHGNPDARLD